MAEEGMSQESFLRSEIQLTPLQVMAIGFHEMYTAYMDAGFDDEQALYLIVELARNGVGTRYDEED